MNCDDVLVGIAHNVQIQIEQLEDDMYGQAMCAAWSGVYGRGMKNDRRRESPADIVSRTPTTNNKTKAHNIVIWGIFSPCVAII